MKIPSTKRPSLNAFTLIEMIGVLAVIGILAALLVPKIFEAINNARVNSTAVSIATIKTAVADHYAKYGTLLSSNGSTLTVTLGAPVTNFDTILLNEQFIDKTLSVKLTDPTNTFVALEPAPAATGSPVTETGPFPISTTATDWGFALASNGPAASANTIAGTAVVAVTLNNVLEADAQALNNLIDGPALGVPLGGGADLYGRVKYTAVSGGLVNMTIYLTHR